MERLAGLRKGSGSIWKHQKGGEDVIVRPRGAGEEAFVIEALIVDDDMFFPIDVAVSKGDAIERTDPSGGSLLYEVNKVAINRDPFGHGNDHRVVSVRESNEVVRPVHHLLPNVTINGGNIQFAFGDSNSLTQSVVQESPALVTMLRELLASAPNDLLDPGDREELKEAIDDAVIVVEERSSGNRIRRATHAVRGVLERLASSAEGGANDVVRAWAREGAKQLLDFVTGS